MRRNTVWRGGVPNDPFVEIWEQIASWVIAHPQRSAGEIFRDVQRLEPGRYHPCQLRTLERGVRKIRSRLQDIMEAFRQEEGSRSICFLWSHTSHQRSGSESRGAFCAAHASERDERMRGGRSSDAR